MSKLFYQKIGKINIKKTDIGFLSLWCLTTL